MRPVLLLAIALLAVPLAGCASDDGGGDDAGNAITPETRPHATMVTNLGTLRIQLYGDLTPQTVQNFGELAQSGFYEDIKFHRVIGPTFSPPNGFMLQGGDPNTKEAESGSNRWGSGGPGYTIIDEFPCKDGSLSTQHPAQCPDGLQVTHDRGGILSMANVGQPRTGGSQFFVTLDATPHLDGKHTVFGHVVEGMDVVRTIGDTATDCTESGQRPPQCQDRPVEPVVIQSVTIEGDLPGVELKKFER